MSSVISKILNFRDCISAKIGKFTARCHGKSVELLNRYLKPLTQYNRAKWRDYKIIRYIWASVSRSVTAYTFAENENIINTKYILK